MKYDFQYQSGAHSFEADFGRVTNATDGGFERGYAAGYTEGETTATEAAEAANAVILTECNEVLPTKGASTAETLEQVPQRIGEIKSYAEGYDVGVEDGKQAEWSSFWDAFQQNGTKTNYDQAFAYGNWTDDCFNPKHDITCGVGVSARQVFYNTKITSTKVPIRVRGNNAAMNSTFAGCNALKTIVLLELVGVTSFSSTFNLCSALENITIEGSIDASFNISASAVLTNTSVQSIIDHLKDCTGATAQTLTFHATVGAKLTEAQKATITAKNWTLVY